MENLGGFVDSERNIMAIHKDGKSTRPMLQKKKIIKHPTQGRLATFWELMICAIKIQL